MYLLSGSIVLYMVLAVADFKVKRQNPSPESHRLVGHVNKYWQDNVASASLEAWVKISLWELPGEVR